MPEHSDEEVGKLKVLGELLEILRVALNSLDGNAPPPTSAASAYMQIVAAAILRAADGYLLLRRELRVDASKLMIRPALESLFAGAAVAKNPDLLIRKARSEWEEEKKMFAKSPDRDDHFQKLWENFELTVRQKEPNRKINPTSITSRELTTAVGWERIYDEIYRLYCKFTHGALRAVLGGLDYSDYQDTEIMTWCAFETLVLLKSFTPAPVPDLQTLHDRLPHGSKVM